MNSGLPNNDPGRQREFISLTPPFYKINWKESKLEVPKPIKPGEWDTILQALKEYTITGLFAVEIPDAVMERLPQLDFITRFGSGGLTDKGLRYLAGMQQLQELDLGSWHSVITDRGLEALAPLKNLRRFDMVWAQHIKDAGLSFLANCDQIERVNLLGTHTGDGLIRVLTGKKKLTHLTTGNGVTDAGIKYLQQFPVFKTWQGGRAAYDLMAYSAEPNHLMIGGTYTDAGLADLAELNGLFGLTFQGSKSQFTDKGLIQLAGLLNLGFFSLDGDRCSDPAMEAIGRFPRLRMLLAQGAVASDAGWMGLSRSSTLEYIWGRECPGLGSEGFKALSTLPALRGLAVSCKFVDDEALALLPQFPSLKELLPMDVNDEGFRHIGLCEQLEALWCMYCRDTTDVATGHIKDLKNLEKYYAGQTRISNQSLELLGKMNSLERVEFWNISGITSEGVKPLARLPKLRTISIDGCKNVSYEATAVFPDHVEVRYSP